MKKVQMVIPMPDDVIEEAAVQAIKSKVREIVETNIDGVVTPIIKETCVKSIKKLLEDRRWNGVDRGVNETLKKWLEKVLAEEHIGKEMDDMIATFKRAHLQKLRQVLNEQMELVGKNAEEIVRSKVLDAVKKAMADIVLDGLEKG